MTMQLAPLALEVEPLPGPLPVFEAAVHPEALRDVASRVRSSGGRLVSLWAADDAPLGGDLTLHVAFALREGLVWVQAPLDRAHPHYPDLSELFPAASRLQRAARDLVGVVADGAADMRKWLRHGAWPEGVYPLRKDFPASARFPNETDAYPFVRVQGEGVHEIPVGPVHAGTIEPGHFRFSIVGEEVVRLEERLGYKHKGIEKLFESMSIAEGARLAGRISGDSTVAYAWAYAMAAENAASCEPPRRAVALRAVLLELERIANHLGDLGYLGNDVALAFGFFQFWRLKEDLLREHAALFGHRYLMDCIVPGGVACDLDRAAADRLAERVESIANEVKTLRAIYDEHAIAQDRFIMTGQVVPELAAKMGLTGLAGRASGQVFDLRADYPMPPYQQIGVNVCSHTRGDVAARVSVRFDELAESARLVQALLAQLPPGGTRVEFRPPAESRRGIGWIEGWRGDVLVALETAGGERLHRVHAADPSWRNWPLLERAVLGNIVPDFPLINKSFNLSYSGQDL